MHKIHRLTINKLNKKVNRITGVILVIILIFFIVLLWLLKKPKANQVVTVESPKTQEQNTAALNLDTNVTGVIKIENGMFTGPANTDDLPEGTYNLYFRKSRVTPIVYDIVNNLTTDNIREGNNLYYTDARVYNALSAREPIKFDSNTGVIFLAFGGITKQYIADGNIYPVHINSINTASDGWVLTFNSSNNTFEWVAPSTLSSETVTTITNTVSGHKIADYTNELGTVVPINETITSLSISGRTLTYIDEDGTTTNIDIPLQTSIWDTDTDTGIDTEASPDEDYLRFYTSGTQKAAIDNNGNVIISLDNPSDFINPGSFSGILFNIAKSALRIGFADNNEWNDSNVGVGTFASGRNNIVSGNYSAAFGGDNTIKDVYSAALGRFLDISSSYTVAGGYQNTASGYASVVFGQQNTVSGRRGMAWGRNNQATADEATAFGYNTQASGVRSAAFGRDSVASGDYSLAFGYGTLASNTYATAFGRSTIASNTYATAWGNDTEASGYGATAFGYRTTASGQYSLAAGYYSEASGYNAVALNDTVANSYMMTAVGRFNVVDNNQSPNTWVDTDYLFVVGNGTGWQPSNRHNAFSIYKNGRLEINAPVDQAVLSSHPTGTVSLAIATVGYVNSHVGDSIFDSDMDTGIQVEANPDEDYIRMQTAGVERFLIDSQGHMRLANNPAATPRAALFEVGSGSESSTFAVSADPNYLNIATFRDEDGENIFRAQGSLANDDLIVTFGDWDWAYDHLSFGINAATDSIDFYSAEIRLHEFNGSQNDYVGFKAPNDVTTNTIWILPTQDGNPGDLLQTNGSGQLSWISQSSLNAPNIYNSDGSLIAQRTVDLSGYNLLFTGSGSVGIGTTSPSAKLQVVGQTRSSSFASANGTEGLPAYRFYNDTDTGLYRLASNVLALTTGGTTRMVLDSNGFVGIGTTSPSASLHIEGGEIWLFNDANNPRFVIGDNGNTGEYGWMQWDSANNYFRIDTSSSSATGLKVADNTLAIGNVYPASDSVFIAANGATEVFRIYDDGRIKTTLAANQGLYTDSNGILTTTPPLTGTLGFWQRSGTTLSPANSGDSLLLDTGGQLTISDFSEGGILFSGASGTLAQDSNNFYWDNTNKRLGVGTNTPNYSLDVNGNANFSSDIHVGAKLYDSTNNAGSSGQVLTVDTSGNIIWKNPVSCVIGGAKVQADGTVINSYGNIASITHSNTGRYRVNFANSLNTNDYYVHLTKMESTSTRDDVNIDVSAYNTDYVDVIIHEGDNGGAANTYRDRAFAITIFDANCVALSEAGNPSDARLKTNITSIENPLSLISRLRGVRYNWNTAKYPNRKDFDNKPEIGLIAQEVKDVVPEVVRKGDDGYYRIEYGKLTALLVEGVKAQQKEINDLQQKTTVNLRFNSLVSKILGLEERLKALQNASTNGTSIAPTPTVTSTPTPSPTAVVSQVSGNQNHQNTDSHQSNHDLSGEPTESTTASAIEQNSTVVPLSKLINGIWNIVSEVIFKYKVTFEKLVTFMSNVTFMNRVQFSDKDMAGYAIIKAGDKVVHIQFKHPYKNVPVVNVSPVGVNVAYYIDNITSQGFDIVINKIVTYDVKFSWLAIYVENYETSYSRQNTSETTPTPTPTITPTASSTPTPTEIPENNPESEASPTSTPTITPAVSPTVTPTNTPTPTQVDES